MIDRIRLRRDTSINWSSNNPVLGSGEPGVELDTNRFKIGNGSDDWNDLPYMFSNVSGLELIIGDGQVNSIYWDIGNRLNFIGSGDSSVYFNNSTNTVSIYTDVNSAVSGSWFVKDITAGSGINIFANSGNYTISSIIQDVPVKNIVAGSGITINSLSGTYTISSSLTGIPSIQSSQSAFIDGGRLTLNQSDPININNSSGSVVYYTPYHSNSIALYNNTSGLWQSYNFNTLSINLSGSISNANYDIFIYNNNGLNMEKIAWINDSSRSSHIIYQDGILVKSGELNKRYIGSIRTINNNTTEDSSYRRFLYNYNNQVYKLLESSNSTIHTYTSTNIRPYNNNTSVGSGSCRTEFLLGFYQPIDLICNSNFSTETSSSSVGTAIDTISSFNTSAINTTTVSSGPALIFTNNSIDNKSLQPGYHYLQLLQQGSSVTTFYSSSLKAKISC